MKIGFSEIMAKQIQKIDYNDASPHAADLIKTCLMDMLGSAIAGSGLEPSRIVREWAASNSGKGDCPVICYSDKMPANLSALVNGTMSHIVELDDVNMHCFGHPGAAIIPAVLSVAYREKVHGKSVLEAILAGYETMGRIGMYLTEEHYKLWHATATLGTFGAAAAVAKVLNLTKSETVNSLGIAGSFAAGLREVFVGGTYCKHLHAGKAAQSGVIAAELAARGFTGPAGIIDGAIGMGKAMTTHVDERYLEKKKEEPWEIEYTEFKPYASCRSAHTSVDCMLELRERALPLDKIKKIQIGTTKSIVYDAAWGCFAPENTLAAKLSIPYNAAVSLLDGEVTLLQFTEERINSAEIKQLLGLMELSVCEEIDRYYPETIGARINIILESGETLSAQVLYPKGHPKNPLTIPEIKSKFSNIALTHFSKESADNLLEGIWALETKKDIVSLLNILNKPYN